MTVTIGTPVQYQFYQRNANNQAGIFISGSYSGFTPTAFEASFNSGTYTTFDTSPTGGYFRGTITGSFGQGTLAVRATNDTGQNSTATYITVTDAFGIWGQSNHVGAASTSEVALPSPPTAKVVRFGNNYAYDEGTDPIDYSVGQVDTVSYDASPAGSYFPFLATRYMQCFGVPPAFVPGALAGSQSSWWLPSGSYTNRSTLFGSGNFRCQYVGGVKTILWWQGETDAVNSTSSGTYNANLDTIASGTLSELGVGLMACKLETLDDTPWIADNTGINWAIGQAWTDNNAVLQGPDFSTRNWTGAHYSNAETWMVAEEWWKAIKTEFGWSENLVQSVKFYQNADTVQVEMPLPVTSGNLIVVAVIQYGGTVMNGSSISDSRSNTYTLIDSVQSYTSDTQFRLGLYYAYNVTGGTDTITFTGSSTPSISLMIAEFSGVTTADPLDRTQKAESGASTSVSSGNTATLSQANEIVFGVFAPYYSGVDSITQGAGYTALHKYEDGAAYMTGMIEHKIVNSTDAVAATFTHLSQPYLARVATFKLATGSTYEDSVSIQRFLGLSEVAQQIINTGVRYPHSGTTSAEDPWLDDDWVTPNNIVLDDSNYANITSNTYDTNDQSYVLKGYIFDFSDIPDTATIVGVRCTVNAYYSAGSASIDLMQLLDVSRAKVGTNMASTPQALDGNSASTYTWGSSSNLWGNALTPTWVKDSDFGVALGAIATAPNTDVFVDYVALEVFYTVPSGDTFEDAVSIIRGEAVSSTVEVGISGNVSLNRIESVVDQSQHDLVASTDLNRIESILASNIATLEADVNLSRANSSEIQPVSTIDSSVSLEKMVSFLSTALLFVEGNLSLNRGLAISSYPNRVLVDIDHETGDLSQYTSTVTDGGDLSVTGSAAMAGTNYGLSVMIDDTVSIFGAVTLGTPDTSGKLRARFYLDPNSLTMSNTTGHYIFNTKHTTSSGNDLCEVSLYRSGAGEYQIQAHMYLDSGTAVTSAYTISDAPHYIEIYLQRATNSTSNDGSLQLWIDGVSKETLSGRDNYDRFVSFGYCKMGATFGVDATTGGTYYMDELVVNNDGSEIGPAVSIVEANLSLNRIEGVSLQASLEFLSSINLGRIEALLSETIHGIEETLNLNRVDALNLQSFTTMEESLSLTRADNLSLQDSLAYFAAISLGRVDTISASALLSISEAISFVRLESFTASILADYAVSVALNRNLSLMSSSLADLEASLSLGRQLSLISVAGFDAEESISINKVLAVTLTPQMVADAAINLGIQRDLSVVVNALFSASLTLARALVDNYSAALDITAATSMLRSLAITTLSEVGTLTYEATLSLARSLAIQTASIADQGVDIVLGSQKGLTASVLADMQDTVSLNRTAQIAAIGGLLLTSVLSLGRVEQISDLANLTIETEIGLSRSEDINQQNIADLAAQLSLGRTVSITSQVQATYETDVTYGKVLNIQVLGGQVYDDAVTLQIIQALSVVAQVSILLGNAPAKLTVRDYTIWVMGTRDYTIRVMGAADNPTPNGIIQVEDTDNV